MDGLTLLLVAALLLVATYCYTRRVARLAAHTDRLSLLAADLRAGGAGHVGGRGRVEGDVRVDVMTDRSSCVGVCSSPRLQVMYWFRLGLDNGQQLTLAGECDQASARAAVAAIRLWGDMWAGASTVTIHLTRPGDTVANTRLGEQVEDCQTKHGVRLELKYEEEDAGPAGGRDLAMQLLRGGGVGQEEEGWHNTNLRMVHNTIHQLVDHTDRLSKHFFEL